MAINQLLHPVQARNRGRVSYCGSWVLGASGAVGAKTGGAGMTLARTAAGLYTLTLESAPAAVLHVVPIIVSNTHTIVNLTTTTTGATFRTGAYASPQTAADATAADIISIEVVALKSLVK